MAGSETTTQVKLLQEFYRANPNRDIPHPEAVDWLTAEYQKRTGKVFRDPDRGIRKLAQKGFLIKVRKGVYRYDPDKVRETPASKVGDFTPAQKQEILRRGNYRCAQCGARGKHGVELHIDHIIAREHGGLSILENGQVLCSQHNFQKKHFGQSEIGKQMYMNLHRLAQKAGNEKFAAFAQEVLEVYAKYEINSHIKWRK